MNKFIEEEQTLNPTAMNEDEDEDRPMNDFERRCHDYFLENHRPLWKMIAMAREKYDRENPNNNNNEQ